MRAVALRRIQIAARGLLTLAVTLIGLLLFTFVLTTLSPVDPALRIAGDRASESTLAQVRTELGFDQRWPVRFGRYLNGLAHGDLAPLQPPVSRYFRSCTARCRPLWNSPVWLF